MIRRPGTLAFLLLATFSVASAGSIERGEYLMAAGGCLTCHTNTAANGEEFAGGRPIESPFGTFFTPNITPDDATGIGTWDEDTFETAMRMGMNPAGDHYYPAFPYTSYTGMRGEDADDIFAYLQNLEPVEQANREHELVWYARYRWTIGLWKGLFFDWWTIRKPD
ncbi:MAG: c-type cytochrome, partial [Gammaproteobacteria bacterium]